MSYYWTDDGKYINDTSHSDHSTVFEEERIELIQRPARGGGKTWGQLIGFGLTAEQVADAVERARANLESAEVTRYSKAIVLRYDDVSPEIKLIEGDMELEDWPAYRIQPLMLGRLASWQAALALLLAMLALVVLAWA